MALNILKAAALKRGAAGKPPLTEKQKALLEAGQRLGSRSSGRRRGGAVPSAIEVPDILSKRKKKRDSQDDIG